MYYQKHSRYSGDPVRTLFTWKTVRDKSNFIQFVSYFDKPKVTKISTLADDDKKTEGQLRVPLKFNAEQTTKIVESRDLKATETRERSIIYY